MIGDDVMHGNVDDDVLLLSWHHNQIRWGICAPSQLQCTVQSHHKIQKPMSSDGFRVCILDIASMMWWLVDFLGSFVILCNPNHDKNWGYANLLCWQRLRMIWGWIPWWDLLLFSSRNSSLESWVHSEILATSRDKRAFIWNVFMKFHDLKNSTKPISSLY